MNGFILAGLWSAFSMLVPAGLTTNPLMRQDDDWEFAADAARNLSVAAVRYEDGKAVVVQCAPVGLRVVLVGLPASPERTRVMSVSRADGRSDTQTWFAEPGVAAMTASVNGRDARFLRGGGRFELRSQAGSAAPVHAIFDLPTQNANLDRVLAACGYASVDERDLLSRSGDDLKSQWEADHAEEIARGPRPNAETRSRSVSGGARPQSRGPSTPPPPTPVDLSCVVRDGALADCRFDHTLSGSATDTERRLRFLTEMKLEPVGAAANEGRVYYPGQDSQPLIMVTVERLM